MNGHLSGVGACLQSENPAAYRILCANHRSDLVLQSYANESKLIGDALSLVQDMAVFIRQSPVRMSVYALLIQPMENFHLQEFEKTFSRID